MRILQRKQQFNNASVDKNGVKTLYADSPGGLRKIKCPSGDGGIAVPDQQSDAKHRFTCPVCGRSFTSNPM